MIKKTALLFSLIVAFNFFFIPGTAADELLNVQKKLDEKKAQQSQIQKELDQIKSQLGSISSSLYATESELNEANAEVEEIKKKLDKVEKEVKLKEKALEQFISVRDEQIKQLYMHPQAGFMELLLGSDSVASFGESFVYQTSIVNKSYQLITVVNEELTEIESERDEIAAIKKDLEATANEIASKATALRSQVSSNIGQQNYLSGQLSEIGNAIKSLSVRQQELIRLRSSLFSTSLGSDFPTGDPKASSSFTPPFSPAFAGFSFGAYTHRNGMSQYGALARNEKSNQNATQILTHYYPNAALNKNYPAPSNIRVLGWGVDCNNRDKYYDETVSFDTYMKRIYEMPESWPLEVQKAQAVAARSYAIFQRNNKGHIQPSQSDQVYKNCTKSGTWATAVNQTKKWVLVQNGAPVFAQYSAVAGGYLNTSGWDTTNGSGSGDWWNRAYEKLIGSHWFYKGWYTKGTSVNSDKCGRSHPWLTSAETADILNAAVVLAKGTSSEKNRISPVTTSCWPGNPYSISQLRSVASKYGGGYNSVSSASAGFNRSNGTTSSIVFQTNKGSYTISGADFKNVFNLRAPGWISIKSPLFNIEKK